MVIFFWPVYRLLAIALVLLAFVTWRFASDLAPFRHAFTSHRLQRELNSALRRENEALETRNEELIQTQQELTLTTEELSRSNDEFDQFAYAASHDLKAPLRAIDSISTILLEDIGDSVPVESRDDLKLLRSRVQRMERMLDGMLTYPRLRNQSFTFERFHIRTVHEDVVNLLHLPSGFRCTITGENPLMRAPRSAFEQVIRNLVDNALQHHHRETGEIRIHSTVKDKWVEITISDDGPGIAPEYHGRVFEIFQTLRRRDEMDSSGMGLALVKRIVEERGGSITLESSVGSGATFRIMWPVAAAETSLDQPVTSIRQPVCKRKRKTQYV